MHSMTRSFEEEKNLLCNIMIIFINNDEIEEKTRQKKKSSAYSISREQKRY